MRVIPELRNIPFSEVNERQLAVVTPGLLSSTKRVVDLVWDFMGVYSFLGRIRINAKSLILVGDHGLEPWTR